MIDFGVCCFDLYWSLGLQWFAGLLLWLEVGRQANLEALQQAFHSLLDDVLIVAQNSHSSPGHTRPRFQWVATWVLFYSDSGDSGTLSNSFLVTTVASIAFKELQRLVFLAPLACGPHCSRDSLACELWVLTLALPKVFGSLLNSLSCSGRHRECRAPFRNFQGTVSSFYWLKVITLPLLLAVLRPEYTLYYSCPQKAA